MVARIVDLRSRAATFSYAVLERSSTSRPIEDRSLNARPMVARIVDLRSRAATFVAAAIASLQGL